MLNVLNLDFFAIAFFGLCVFGYSTLTRFGRLSTRSITHAVQQRRVQWMSEMATRELRMVDTQIVGQLSQGNAFFASTTAIAVGGLTSMISYGGQIEGLLERIPYAAGARGLPPEVKLITMIAVFTYAFFKFAWAYRLTHYTAIMIGATPEPKEDASNASACLEHSLQTAELAGISASHSNAGLRSFYYAIAVLAWFFHPLLFVLATTWVQVILIRRDYFSRSRRLIARL